MSKRNAEIVNQYKSGKTLEEIASQFGVTRSRIQQIINRQIERQVIERFGISVRSIEEQHLLRAAVKEEISEIVQKRRAQSLNEKVSSNSSRIKTKLDSLPGLQNFVTLSSLSRAIGEDVADVKLYAPEVAKSVLNEARRKWSRNYTRCRNCGTTTVKHHSYGLCRDCYPKSELFKDMQRSYRLRNLDKWKIKMKEYAQSYKNRPYVKEKMKQKNDLKFFGGNRAKVLIRDGFRCQSCGRTQEQSLKELGRDLFVRHLKGPENHELENLITVCQKCHIKNFIKSKLAPVIPNDLSEKIIDQQDSYSAIINIVSDAFGVSQKNILSYSRRKDFVMPRHVAMYLLRKVCNYSYPRIGMMFNRDHTSVIHAEKRVKEFASSDVQFRSELDALEKDLAIKNDI